MVNTSTHVGLGTVGEVGADVFSREELATIEGCDPKDRCWLDLIRMCSGHGRVATRLRLCSDPDGHGGLDSPMHTYKAETKQSVRKMMSANKAHRDAEWSKSSGSIKTSSSSKSGKSSTRSPSSTLDKPPKKKAKKAKKDQG